jgi:long-chain acyl-CoA synthetase
MANPSIRLSLEYYREKTPEKVALIMEGKELSYEQLFLRASTMALFFCDRGLERERIAVHLPNSIDLAVIYLASLLADATIIPLSIPFKPAQVMHVLSETSPKALIGDASSYEVPFEEIAFFPLHELLTLPTGAYKKNLSPSRDQAAAIFYTSGSTNQPKGVVHSERSLSAMMDSMVDSLDLTTDGRFVMSEPMSNCSGYTQSLLPLLIGATTIMMPSFSIEGFIDAVRHHPTRMSLMGKGNHDIIASPQLTRKHFAGITLNLSGGDKISQELMENFKEKTGVPIRLGYGMSECLLLTVNKSRQTEKMGSVGQAAKHADIRLLDPSLQPVALGEIGEVWVKGPHCMLGYWKEPELTSQTIVDGWLRTGDLARCDREGFYWFSGRLKQMIIRDGENISPFEIEEVLMKHPAVYAVGVIGIPDPTEGEVPHAFVELKKGQTVTEIELISFAQTYLEENKIPAAIFIVDQLPRTLSGKIARSQLKSRKTND